MYRIKDWFPRRGDGMGGASFTIVLKKEWFEAVKKSGVTQEHVDNIVKTMGRQMLKGNGWSETMNPETHIRIWWFDGMPTIQVPGSATQIGYEGDGWIGLREGEKALVCHNVDTLNQASLILTIFVYIANYIELCVTT